MYILYIYIYIYIYIYNILYMYILLVHVDGRGLLFKYPFFISILNPFGL